MRSAHALFVRTRQATLKRVGSGVAVYLPEQKAIHVLNQTAELLYALLEEPISPDELVDALSRATDGEPDQIASDVEAMLGEFLDKGIIVEVSE